MTRFRLAMTVLSSFVLVAFSSFPDYFNCSSVPICICVKDTDSSLRAKCSRRRLDIFPDFDEEVRYIDLSENLISELTTRTRIPADVRFIDLAKNKLKFIYKGVFSQSPRLEYLNLSYNRELKFNVVANISFDLQFTSIKALSLNAIHCENGRGTTVQYNDFHLLSNTSLRELSLASNRIEWVENNVIRSLPKTIQKADISDNRFTFGYYLIEVGYFDNIKEVNLSYTSSVYGLAAFAGTFCWAKEMILPSLYVEIQSEGSHRTQQRQRSINFTIHFPRQLEVLDVTNNFYHLDEVSRRRVFYDLPNLKVYNARRNLITKFIGENGFPMVESIDLSSNYCKNISATYFKNNTRLKQLMLNDNSLADLLADPASFQLFKDLYRLEYLDLSSNSIRDIHDALMSPLIQIHHLRLALNNIETVKFSLAHMKKLEKLDLSSNKIRFLTQTTMGELEQICKSHQITIDLNQNALICSCDTLPFIEWMHRVSNHCIYFENFKYYRCSYTNLTQISLLSIENIISDLRLQCSSKTGLIAVVSTVLVAGIGIILSSIVYRYRWKLRYWYYATKRVFLVSNPVYRELYRYKVFLSYADEDKEIALNEILRTFEENGESDQVCFHARDFTPGRSIADNIAAAVHNSRFTVCIISSDYLDSYWCMYEFNLAKMETVYARGGENAVLLIVTNKCRFDSIPLIMLDHMDRESYLEVPALGDHAAKSHFLATLRRSIL